MQKGIDLMQQIMNKSNEIENLLGVKLKWTPSNKRAQYIYLNFHEINDPEIPKFKSLEQGEYDTLQEEDFPLIVKFLKNMLPNLKNNEKIYFRSTKKYLIIK